MLSFKRCDDRATPLAIRFGNDHAEASTDSIVYDSLFMFAERALFMRLFFEKESRYHPSILVK